MQDEAAEKMDEILTPIEISAEINQLGEGKPAAHLLEKRLPK
jgi:hypothetical protein